MEHGWTSEFPVVPKGRPNESSFHGIKLNGQWRGDEKGTPLKQSKL